MSAVAPLWRECLSAASVIFTRKQLKTLSFIFRLHCTTSFLGARRQSLYFVRKSRTENMMAKYRNNLPQMGGKLFLTDSGMETSLIYHQGIELPHFASFDLMKDAQGRGIVEAYYAKHAELAKAKCLGFVLETPTCAPTRIGARRSAIRKVNSSQ